MKLLIRCALVLFWLAAPPALAQVYPSRPITVIVTIPAGGGPDLVARVVAEKLSSALRTPIAVENKSGSNGNIAGDAVAHGAPDGYTLLVAGDSLFTVNPHLYRTMSFDPRRDLIPVASLTSHMFVLAVHPSIPVRTLNEFVEYARRSRPPLAYASGGNGSQHHLLMERLKQVAAIDLLHVPYRGGQQAVNAVVAGDVAAVFSGTSVAPHVQAGRLRALAVTGNSRSSLYPSLPALAERYPGLDMSNWAGLFAPAETPAAVVERLATEVSRILADPQVIRRLSASGELTPLSLPRAEFAARIAADSERYRQIVERVGLRLD